MNRNTWIVALSLSLAFSSSIPPTFSDQVLMQSIIPARASSPAVKDFTQEIQSNPSAANYKKRADVLRQLGMRKEAIDDLNQSLTLEPANVAARVLQGQVYFEDGMYPEGISSLNNAISLDPKFAASYELRAKCYLKLKEYAKALADANTLLTDNANSAVGYLLRGAAFVGLKKYSNAVDDLTAAIKADPNMDKAFYWRAEAYQNAGDYQKSVDDYSQAIKLEPSYRPAYLGRAWSYYKLGKDAEALQDCSDAIKFRNADDLKAVAKFTGEKATDPDIMPDPEYNLGMQIEEDLKNALVLFDDILKDKPGDRDAFRDRGIAFMHLGRYRDAIKDFDAANKGLPLNPEGFSGLGSQDAYNSAVTDYKQGNVSLSNGDYSSAIESYESALKKYPQYARCWHNLAIASATLGDHFTAELCCIHAISYRPDDWKLWNTLGFNLYHEYKADKGDPNKLSAAAAALHQSLSLNPDSDSDKNAVRQLLASVKAYERSLAPVSDFVITTMPIN